MSSSLEEIKNIDLEEWLTLATAPAPTKLKQGQTPDMQNVWTDEKPGSIITAPGYVKVGQIPSGNPVSFCINYFKTSAGTQTFVVSDNSTVWTTVDFQNFTSIITGLSSSFQLRGSVIRDKLWLTNGSDAVRTFDGTTVTVLDGTSSTPNVPRGRFINYHDERVWLYHVSSARSAVYFSSLTDSSANIIDPDNQNAWDTTDNFLQISEGDADFGTGMILYRGYLHFFKQYSIWRLVGYDEYTYSRVKTRASTGTRFNESVQILDSLVHLIGVDGIYVFDGEESVRISDIIDPATASQTAFGFNQLQQPNTNNQFWEVQSTADWNAGTVPNNVLINNALNFVAADDSQADFQAGATLTNIDTTSNPGFIELSSVASGGSNVNVSQGQLASLSSSLGTSTVGNPAQITDGVISGQQVGFFESNTSIDFLFWNIDLGNSIVIGSATLRGLVLAARTIQEAKGTLTTVPTLSSIVLQYSTDNVNWSTAGQFVGNISGVQGPTDYSVSFSTTNARYWRAFATFPGGNGAGGTFAIAELQIFRGGFNLTGKFVSKTLDLGTAPASLGNFNATETLNGETTAYFTQSSNDGSSWDAETSVSNGGSIGSIPRRYLRWGVNLTSDGNNTPQIDAAYLPSVYLSAIHNTGGAIFSWGPFESDYFLASQTISFYYRGASLLANVPSASWNLIVPGGVLSIPTGDQFVQFKIEISGGTAVNLPIVDSVTINWVTGSAGQPQTLQNVASVYWRNRYWLSAAGPGATENNTILIRGKKTFNSPWMLKDWSILSFTRYFDSLYGGSSVDGSILQLDTGYSKNAAAIDSYFETHDFTFGGFTANLVELLVEVERTGPWTLLVGVSVDSGNTFDDYPVDLTPNGPDTNFCKRLMGNIAGKNFSYTTTKFRLRFRTNGVDTPFQVHRCVAYYKLSAVRGSIKGDYM